MPNTRRSSIVAQRLTETLKQGQYQPLPVEEQVVVLWAATNGPLDSVPVEDVRNGKRSARIPAHRHSDLLNTIKTEKELSDQTIAALTEAVGAYKGGSKWATAARSSRGR